MNICKISDFNPSDIKCGKRRGNKIPLHYSTGPDSSELSKLRIQTPKMKVPFDSKFQNGVDGKPFANKFAISFEKNSSESNQQNSDLLYKKIQESEEIIKKLAGEIPGNFYSSLYQKGDYAPVLNVSYSIENGEHKVKVFNKKRDLVSPDSIKRNMLCSFIITLEQVWISKNGYGINWVVEQAVVYDTVYKKRPDVILINDEEDDE